MITQVVQQCTFGKAHKYRASSDFTGPKEKNYFKTKFIIQSFCKSLEFGNWVRKTNFFLIFKKAYGGKAIFIMLMSYQQILWVNIYFITHRVKYIHNICAYFVCVCFCMWHVHVSFSFGRAHNIDFGTQCYGTNYSKHLLQLFRSFP